MEQNTPDVSISSLSEYIEIIKKCNLNGNYFRGENKKYPSITSSLLRNYIPSKDTYGLIDIYIQLLKEYYNEIGSELNKLQLENFLAFSQHHGLRTNLIDFTFSPVVALYFACDSKESDKSSGYIYILNKENTVDASKFLAKYSFKGYEFKNFLRLIQYQDEEILNDFSYLIQETFDLSPNKDPRFFLKGFKTLIEKFPVLEKSNGYFGNREILLNDGAESFLNGFENFIKTYLPKFDILNKGINIIEYVTLLTLYLDDLSLAFLDKNLIPQIPFPQMPYLIYKTPLKFDRIRNQNGVFVYQPFIDYQTDYEEIGGLAFQNIVSDFTIEIKNKHKVMNELDSLGINRRFIYGDFDNTAQYINNKYFKK